MNEKLAESTVSGPGARFWAGLSDIVFIFNNMFSANYK